MNVDTDKQKIHDLISTWIAASRAGDTASVLKLMADDVVFLKSGQPPMRGRDAFAQASRSMEGKVILEREPEVQEIEVSGSFAYAWIHLFLKITPLPNGPARKLAGHILSVYRKNADGNWELLRDANMLVPVS